MKKIKLLGVLVLALFLLVACGAKGETLDKNDNGKQVNYAVGEEFSVVLASNPTTGYRWEVGEIDRTVLRQLGAEYDADASELVGAGGAEIFTFEAIGTGETELTLVYRRSWEDVEPEETFSLQVVVEK